VAYASLVGIWILFGIVLVKFGVILNPERPAEYMAHGAMAWLLDVIPTLWVGWGIHRGSRSALRAGIALAVFRIAAQASLLFGFAPGFGGLYDEHVLRTVTYSLLIAFSSLLLFMNGVALVAYETCHPPWFAQGSTPPVVDDGSRTEPLK
jgi:hypothetical protein